MTGSNAAGGSEDGEVRVRMLGILLSEKKMDIKASTPQDCRKGKTTSPQVQVFSVYSWY